MKALTFPTLLGTLALLLASCDKPKVAAPPPPPGSDGKFANGGATGLVARIRALSIAVQEAQKAGDTSKNEQFMARAMTLLTEGRSHAASVTRAEMPQFVASLNEFAKSMSELSATLAPEIAARFAVELNNTNQMLAAATPASSTYASVSGAELQKMSSPPASSSIPPMKSYSGAPKGSGKFDSSQKYETPSASTEPSRPPPETPASPATPAPEAPATPAVPAVPEIK